MHPEYSWKAMQLMLQQRKSNSFRGTDKVITLQELKNLANAFP